VRKTEFVNDHFFHIYNRGVDKRNIFLDEKDIARFVHSMEEFNTLEPIGSIYEHAFVKKLGSSASKSELARGRGEKLVEFACYCLNPNHYHILLKQVVDKGVEKFMQRIGTGYTNYFNNRYQRSGALFQGHFKSVSVDSNEYLLHVSVYINLNSRVHYGLGSSASKSELGRSSWGEYLNSTGRSSLCQKEIILGQFNRSQSYKGFAEDILPEIIHRKELKELLEED
jgi:REP element-mobilizing transposase RayT